MITEETIVRGTETGEIVYKSGNKVVSSLDAQVNGFAFDYHSNSRIFRFNNVLGDNRWRFVPVDSKLQVFISDDPTLKEPEVHLPFYVSKYLKEHPDIIVIYDELFEVLATLCHLETL